MEENAGLRSRAIAHTSCTRATRERRPQSPRSVSREWAGAALEAGSRRLRRVVSCAGGSGVGRLAIRPPAAAMRVPTPATRQCAARARSRSVQPRGAAVARTELWHELRA
eukprot:scaffold271486_cov37-Tisochrysis_lutea.AAC.1